MRLLKRVTGRNLKSCDALANLILTVKWREMLLVSSIRIRSELRRRQWSRRVVCRSTAFPFTFSLITIYERMQYL